MEKTVHASVTECGSDSPSEKNVNEIIQEIAIEPPAQQPAAPTYPIQRSTAAQRRRKQKPLPLDRFAHAFHRTPQGVKLLLIIISTGIPFMIFMLVARYKLQHRPIGPKELDATYFKLAKWMTVCWASLLIIFGLAESLARGASWACSLSKHWIKYAPLANTLCFRVTMLVWAAAAYQANCSIWNTDIPYKGSDDWPATLKQVFVFLIVSFAILLLQGIGLQLIAIRYVEGYIGPRSKQASNELETIHDLNNLVKRHIEHDDPSYAVKLFKKVFFPVVDDAYEAILNGRANEAAHRDYAATIWNTVAGQKEILLSADISSRLTDMGRDPEAAEDLFAQLDESCDGKVTRDELETLVVNTGAQLNKRADSMRGIKQLLFKLEILLTVLVFGVIVFIYSNFFNQDWVKDSKALWTGFTGLGFALNGIITEFVNSCIFVFAKHAYDVGDLVEAKGKKLLVCDIHLTHTNFQETRENGDADTSGMIVQISHATLAPEVIVNWTRSNDLKIAKKEKDECCDAQEERKATP